MLDWLKRRWVKGMQARERAAFREGFGRAAEALLFSQVPPDRVAAMARQHYDTRGIAYAGVQHAIAMLCPFGHNPTLPVTLQDLHREELRDFMARQRQWSARAFPCSHRVGGLLEHMRHEIAEVEENPDDIAEWCDVISMALDGAKRRGFTTDDVMNQLWRKLHQNMRRKWIKAGDGTAYHDPDSEPPAEEPPSYVERTREPAPDLSMGHGPGCRS